MRPIYYYLITLFLAILLLPACEITENNNPNPTPTSPDTVTVLTNAIVSTTPGGTIDAEDTTRTIPSGQAAAIEWSVRPVGGSTGPSQSTPAGGEVSFSVSPGDYVLTQKVILNDQSEAPPKTYNVTVVGKI